ncbi:MAG: VOC family protein [Bacillati bacterium ANGP1]|uniref:VOC family protein n=1 Tax=Candidatus Segetimicrobium genomatis TaxID=2569760 RepID=A0A537JWX2_9BACT|nr:MAG: VOC family protein [Terrabacteria group bacterium ANGP1]
MAAARRDRMAPWAWTGTSAIYRKPPNGTELWSTAMNRPPRVSLDHILVAVPDLAEGRRRFATEYGLRALEGGRHPGVGTANMIIPLGSEYLELIAVVDAGEAGRAPTGRLISRAISEGRTFATWAVRTDDLEGLRGHLHDLGLALPAPAAGARERPDGVVLRWRTQFLEPPPASGGLPFVIEWSVPSGMHPGASAIAHPSGARRISAVRLGDPSPQQAAARIRALLGDGLPVAVEQAGTGGVLAVELVTPDGPLVIR